MQIQLNEFFNKGIKNISDTIGRFYRNNRQGRVFMIDMAAALFNSSKIRKRYEQKGTHIPPFLIASISSDCNLHCAGCYARANGNCSDEGDVDAMGLTEWYRIFTEASGIGVSFILLAGGEPLLRRDLIKMAASLKNMIFPIFTNGTMIDTEYIELFDNNRNLVPVLSIECSEAEFNARRGAGVSEQIRDVIEEFKRRGILYGVSITVTSENKDRVTEGQFINNLREQGCGVIFFVEYVPVETGTEHLLLNHDEVQVLQNQIELLRNDKQNKGMVLLSFPGDEESMGGCLAAGRGFFHINVNGGCEPCPFSSYSTVNLKEQTIMSALQSPFFEKVRNISAAEKMEHKGGCTLFLHQDEVIRATKEEQRRW